MNNIALSLLAVLGFATQTLAASYVERDGRYEINWSTGKVRFYGVGKIADGDQNYRAAEQRAWADGLKAAEAHFPKVFAGRLGAVDKTSIDKLSKLSAATVSVSTTYFGDSRVKVLLEAPIQKVTPQLVSATPSGSPMMGESKGLIIKLPKGAKPFAFVKVLDEHGREMVSSKELMNQAHLGAPMVKWYRNSIDSGAGAPAADAPAITGTMPEAGVVRVSSADWKPTYAAAMTRGAAAFLVQ